MPVGRTYKPISREDVERAIRYSKSNAAAARYLGISHATWKKNASRYTGEDGKTLYESHNNITGKGIPKLVSRRNKEAYLMDILEGRVASHFVSIKRIKERLVEEGYMEDCCNNCGFSLSRPLDEKKPLILNFLNKNKKDWRLENMEFLCYNCYFLSIGNIFTEEQLEALEIYQSSSRKKITQFDLPPQHEEGIEKAENINNIYVNEMESISPLDKPDDYGDDLISFQKSRR
jgi:hypothetical protein